MIAYKNPFLQATRSLFMSSDPSLDFPRWSLKRDSSVSKKIATLDYQQYTDKNTFVPQQVYRNRSCYRCHHNWHCDQSDLFAVQFSSVLWCCWVIYMKNTYMPSSYIWVSFQGFILKQNGNTKTNPGPVFKTPCIVFILHTTKTWRLNICSFKKQKPLSE